MPRLNFSEEEQEWGAAQVSCSSEFEQAGGKRVEKKRAEAQE
jgi:hypothetical protein